MVIVEAPGEQAVFFDDVEPREASGWRAGIDQFHDPDEFSKAVIKLREKEQTDFRLSVEHHNGSCRLLTTTALKENEVVGIVTAMLFSRAGLLRDFMNQGGSDPTLAG
jgi:hypothetical protein